MRSGGSQMCTKRMSIVKCLANAKTEYTTSLQLSALLNVSSRSALRYVQEAQRISTENGFKILAHKGRGYTLEVTDQEKFGRFISEGDDSLPLQFSEKNLMKVAALILTYDNIRLDDLAEEFHYSRSSMSRMTASVAKLFKNYGIRLGSRAHAGLTVQGKEIAVRNCMCRVFFSGAGLEEAASNMQLSEEQISGAKQSIDGFVEQNSLRCTAQGCEQFLKYLFVTVYRIRGGHGIRFDRQAASLVKVALSAQSSDNRGFLFSLLSLFIPNFGSAHLAKEEITYLTLIWEQSFFTRSPGKENNPSIVPFFRTLVQKSLDNIQEKYGVDLTKDTNLFSGLVDHISSCFGKYILDLETDNSFLAEARKNYPSAYYYSIELSECIWEQTGIRISNNELGYISLYFASSIERNEKHDKYRVIILCNTAFGTAALLNSRISTQYEEINVVDVCAINDAKQIRSDIDFYITTVPMKQMSLNGKSVLLLSPFLKEDDKKSLADMLAQISQTETIQDICSPERFSIIEKPCKKTELLEMLTDDFVRRGLLTHEEKQAVFDREALVSTEIAENIAMPHCIIQGPSFISFYILRTPVMWGKAKISLLIFGCFHEGDAQIKKLLSQLFAIVSDPRRAANLISSTNYSEFLENLKI